MALRENFVIAPSKLFFEDFPPGYGRYSKELVLYLDANCTTRVSQSTWKEPITSVLVRLARINAIGNPVCVFVRNELGAIVSKIIAKPLGESTGAMRISFAKDYGGKPLSFNTPGQETVVFEGLLYAGQVVPFWVRFEVLSTDFETLDDFQIQVTAQYAF